MTFLQNHFFDLERSTLTKMDRCHFNTKYFDYSKKEPATFACDEIALPSGLCIFHDKNYDNDKKLGQKISEKIKSVLAKNFALFFIGYNIPDLKIKETFTNVVYFTKASFTNTDFSNSKFQKVDFSGAKFQNANFSKATFKEADFLAVEFSGEANFSNTVFKKKVNFSESVFKKANFSGSTMKRAQFLGCKFQTADFGFTKIEDSDFYGILFSGVANFVGTDIKRSVFPNSRFQGKTCFTGAKFEKTEFPQSRFGAIDFDHVSMKVMKLHGTTFSGTANFFSSKLEKVDLYKANFEKNSNFAEATLREVTFSDGKFQGNSNFAYAIFQDDVKFKNVELQGADFSYAKFFGKTYFNDVLFRKQDRVNFDVEDLSQVSFRNTDVTKVRFGERVKWGGDDGFRIIDEELLNKNNEKKILESIIATYRNLRKNYERRFRNEEAQMFFLRELKLKKLYNGEDTSLMIMDSELIKKKLEDLSHDLDELKEKVDNLEKLAKRKQEPESNKVH